MTAVKALSAFHLLANYEGVLSFHISIFKGLSLHQTEREHVLGELNRKGLLG